MRRMWLAIVAALALAGLTAVVAIAANPHFVGTPTCTENNSGTANATVTCSGKVAGLGSFPTKVTVTANGTLTCTNRGGNDPPGQIRSAGSQFFPAPRNGQITFRVSTDPVGDVCPDRMRETVEFSSVTITVEQPVGTVVLQRTFSV